MITEMELLNGYKGITNGLMNISEVNGKRITWDYRRGQNGDGYNPAVTKREDATQIYLYDIKEMIDLEKTCENHENLSNIYKDYENALSD